jgi:GYF domain 2
MSAPQDAKNWFVLLKGKRYGPYTFAALAHAAEKGVVDPEAGVWCLGWAEWRIARNVPGLFAEEPEPPADDHEEDADSVEEYAEEHVESEREEDDRADEDDLDDEHDLDDEDDRDEEDHPDRGNRRNVIAAMSPNAVAASRLAAARVVETSDLRAPSRDTNETATKPDEAPSLGLSAGPRMSVSTLAPEPEAGGRGGGVRLAILSVLVVLVILSGAGWAAISLGFMRVEFMLQQSRQAAVPATASPAGSAPAASVPAPEQTADATALSPARNSTGGVPDIVADMPAVAALKTADPDAYAKFAKRFASTYKADAADDEMLTRARTALRKSIKRLLAKASTESLLEITEVNLAYMRALQPGNPGSCVALSDESKGATLDSNLARDYAPLFRREMAVLERIVSGAGTTEAAPTETEVRPYLEAVFGELKKQPVQTQLLGRDKLTAAEYAPYCDLVIAFYEAVRALPFADAVKLLRNLYTTAAAEPDTDKP